MSCEEYFKDAFSVLLKFRNEDILCDTVLMTGNNSLRAHSLILAAASPLLRSVVQKKSDGDLKYIHLPEFDLDTLGVALDFIYTGRLLLPAHFQDDVSVAQYSLDTLRTKLESLGLSKQKLHDCEIKYKRLL